MSWRSSLTSFTSFAIALSAALTASPTVAPEISAITGPSCTSLLRSHSHADSRGGLPIVAKKPSGSFRPVSASCAARKPVAPGMFDFAPVTLMMLS